MPCMTVVQLNTTPGTTRDHPVTKLWVAVILHLYQLELIKVTFNNYSSVTVFPNVGHGITPSSLFLKTVLFDGGLVGSDSEYRGVQYVYCMINASWSN